MGTYHFDHSFIMHRVQTLLKSLISLIYDNQYVPIYNNNNNTYYVLRNNNNMPKQKDCCCSKKVVLSAINHAHKHSSTCNFWYMCNTGHWQKATILPSAWINDYNYNTDLMNDITTRSILLIDIERYSFCSQMKTQDIDKRLNINTINMVAVVATSPDPVTR